MQINTELKRRTLSEMGVSFNDCYTCQDNSCSANVIHKETGEEYNLYIRKYNRIITNELVFDVDGRVTSNSDSNTNIYKEFTEENELVEFLCKNFSGFKCF